MAAATTATASACLLIATGTYGKVRKHYLYDTQEAPPQESAKHLRISKVVQNQAAAMPIESFKQMLFPLLPPARNMGMEKALGKSIREK